MTTLTDPDALPQLIGDYLPADQWQVHINKIFYALRGNQLRDFYQTFASADHRLAHALAAHYYAKVKAREFGRAGGPGQVASGKTESAPGPAPRAASPDLIIHEWGCGNGNLAACFLSHLKAIDDAGLVYPRVRYVLVDSHAGSLEAAKAHPELADHLGRVETVCADVTNLSGVADRSVDRIICNELWNDLPTKLMLRMDAEFEEEFIRPNLRETRYAEIPDWSRFVRAFEAGDGDVLREFHPFLDDIVWEKEYRKLEWKDVPFRKTITEFMKTLEEQVLVPVNVGAAQSIKEAKRLLRPDGIGFSSFDAGAVSRQVLNDPDKPCYGQYGGQFSFVVNFPLLEAVAKYVGAVTIETEPQKSFLGRELGTNVVSLMDLLATHPSAGVLKPAEQDELILNTIRALDDVYRSPYRRKLDFPLRQDIPQQDRDRLHGLLSSINEGCVPDTVAYLTEEELLGVRNQLEALGFDPDALATAIGVPPQEVDYTHFFLRLA